ncbi:MAG: hypothetical protein RLZZ427_1691 [Pseudomonadota bacterium]
MTSQSSGYAAVGRRRGEPVVALMVLIGGWIGARAALLTGDAPDPLRTIPFAESAGPATSHHPPRRASAGLQSVRVPEARRLFVPVRSAAATIEQRPTAIVPHVPVQSGAAESFAQAALRPEVAPPPNQPPRQTTVHIAAGHQLLWLAGLAELPLPPEVTVQRGAVPLLPLSAHPLATTPAAVSMLRWSADGWLLWRQGGNGYALPASGSAGGPPRGGAYGASQAGVVVRYRLAPASALRPVAYVRATSAFQPPRGAELAAGLALRPARRMAIAATAEVRVVQASDGAMLVRPGASLISEFPPLPLPLGLRGEAYLAAGYVGGTGATPFADGSVRIDRRVATGAGVELRAGGGAWGGAQRGAQRLDLGPTITLGLPVGRAGARLSADWRFRVAGAATPDSGAAVTLSAGF